VVVSFAYDKEIHLVGPAYLVLKYRFGQFATEVPPALLALQSGLQHEFSRPAVAVQRAHAPQFSADHNERLEFLGDSVLNLAVATCCTSG
jgi:hypothetical protein